MPDTFTLGLVIGAVVLLVVELVMWLRADKGPEDDDA